MKKYILLLSAFVLPGLAFCQQSTFLKQDSLYKFIQPFAVVQSWATYTMGEKARLSPDESLEPVVNRLNITARRARLGFKGTPYKNFSYYLSLFYDNLGRDRYSGTRAGINDGQIGVWDAFMSWKMSSKHDLATLTFGYFRPQLSRECITAYTAVNSFEKSLSQTYIRQHMMGKNHGRTMGINIGGLKKEGFVSMNYNVGLFNNNTTSSQTETAGVLYSPLLTGRLAFSFGDPEMDKYGISYDINYFNKRKGVTIGVNASRQGHTDIYNLNMTKGVDVLVNYLNFNMDGEWMALDRSTEVKQVHARTGHIRGGYNLIINKKLFIEPTFLMTFYDGQEGGQFNGQDRIYDAGVNWYMNKKNCKLGLHYVWQEGHGKNGYTDGVTFEKGDYVGLGFLIML
ncbi:porin [Rhodocytophaga aerolata]|uniref:Porin n=1 Tax=Rhodocytophaga aerolata TaxID=455078 RepID=A0ABT8RBH4_9BACT|nr:porin [Rhodocytophaga aerolata]MDO1448107.1 porin [Rhodocytophaga aerolata]